MAFVSILHRISGFLWILILPIGLYVLELSLRSESDFRALQQFFEYKSVSLFIILALLFFIHHFLMGIRFLLLDMQIGLELASARNSARLVLLLDILALLLLIGAWWL